MKHKKFDFRTAYIDLLLNFLTSVIFIFVLTTLIIQAKKQNDDEGPRKNAQYILTATWAKEIDCDVDIWVKDPLGNVVSYKVPSNGIMHIERDDMGHKNDYYYDSNKNLVSKTDENKEVWTLRGKLKGEYTVNLHLYACRKEYKSLEIGTLVDLHVQVELLRLNPYLLSIKKQDVVLISVWDEITVFNFTMDKTGFVEKFTYNPKRLIKVKDP